MDELPDFVAAQNAIARVTEVSTVLAAGAVRSSLESLRATGVTLRVVES